MAQEKAAEENRAFADELKPGTQLLRGQYTIVKFLNSGGFGITYLARTSLDREVVIKECFPGSYCRRNELAVTPRSRAHLGEFQKIVRLFVQEAKSLAKLIHPNIIGVHQVFEDNETAYMAMDYVDGRDLMEMIEKDRASLTPALVVPMLRKLLVAVGFIHGHGMLHRDISPDNILLDKNRDPILIDFGAARQQASEVGGKALSAMRVVKEGYSPQEFYVSGSIQNQSSDLYGLAATFYHVISGEAPPDSQARLVAIAEDSKDPYVPLAGRIEGYPEAFLAGIDKALRVLPRDRLQSAQDWIDLIDTRPGLKVVTLRNRVDEKSALPGKGATEAIVLEAPIAARVVPGRAPKAGSAAAAGAAAAPAAVAAAAPAEPPFLLEGATADPQFLAASLRPRPAAPPQGANRKVLFVSAAVLVTLAIGIGVYPMIGPKLQAFALARATAPEQPAPAAETAGAETVAAAETPAAVAAPDAGPAVAGTGFVVASLPADPEPAVPAFGGNAAETGTSVGTTAPALPENDAASLADFPASAAAAAEVVASARAMPAAPDAADPAIAEESAAGAPAADGPAVVPSDEPATVAEVQPATEPAALAETAPAGEPAAKVPTPPASETLVAVAEPEPPATAAEPVDTAAAAPAVDVPSLPGIDPAVAADQIAEAIWQVSLPFETVPAAAGGRTFPQVSAVMPEAAEDDLNNWIAQGVMIYAVDGTFVSDAAGIIDILRGRAGSSAEEFFYAPARVKTEPTSPFREVTLAVRNTLQVKLRNGVAFETRAADGAWWAVVTEVAEEAEGGLRVGDVLLADALTGERLNAPHSVELATAVHARELRSAVVFEVERGGVQTRAAMTLARNR